MFANCWAFTGATLHYIFVLCIQNCLLCLRLPSYNRHMSCATKFLLKRGVGLETLAGCLVSSGHHPCVLGVRCFSGPGLHHLPSFSTQPSPSCGTCGGGKSPVHCGVVKAERQKGCLSPGKWQWQPCCPFWGWPWKNPHGCYCLHHCWACCPGLQWSSGDEPEAHLFVAVQGRGGHEGLLQALPTSIACIVMHDDYVVQV